MGAVCPGGTITRSRKSAEVHDAKCYRFSGKLKSVSSFGKPKRNDEDFCTTPDGEEVPPSHLYNSGELNLSISQELKPPTNKVSQTSFLGKARIVGLEKAVEVLDTLGSSMTSLNSGGGFSTGVNSRGNRISILAFEVANTIAKGSTLLQSLSEENVQFLKKDIMNSEGVRQLVSTDVDELLSIAAADKREEFDVFSREVIRFGNMCKDPQWHNLDRFFDKSDSDPDVQNQLREEAEITMQELTMLAQHTSELYHEFHALDRFQQDYERKIEELDPLNRTRKGDSIAMLQSELKHQRKLVRSLKRKSLWEKSMEQIVEKLVDIVMFMHQEILEVFGSNASMKVEKVSAKKPARLGVAGLALHYANIITQIDNIASRPTSLPPNMRDTLYNGLPPAVKMALRSRLQIDAKEVLTVPQIKAEMEKSLHWLVPLATDTTKAHQGFGWVGEWANTGHEFGKKMSTSTNLIRLQTLYHANKHKADSCILDLVTWLHRLISLVQYRDNGSKAVPIRSLNHNGANNVNSEVSNDVFNTNGVRLSIEDRILLEQVMKGRRLVPRLSKSQEFVLAKNKKGKMRSRSRSTGSSPKREMKHKNIDVLDVLDGLDSSFSIRPRRSSFSGAVYSFI